MMPRALIRWSGDRGRPSSYPPGDELPTETLPTARSLLVPRHLPQSGRAVLAPGQDRAAVGAERYGPEDRRRAWRVVLVAQRRAERLPRFGVPELCGPA